MSKEKYTDSEGNVYSCEHIIREGDQLIHSKLCRTLGAKQCPHYKKCTGFTRHVNIVNSPAYKFQSMVSGFRRKEKKIKKMKPKVTKIMAVSKDDINLNIGLTSLFDENMVMPRIVSESKRFMAEERRKQRENTYLKIKRTKWLIKEACYRFDEDKEIKEWLDSQGVKWLTEAERDILKRAKRRTQRGIILNGGKPKRKYTRRSAEEIERYESAGVLDLSEFDWNNYVVLVEKKEEVII